MPSRSLRDHKVIGPSLKHLVSKDKHFKNYFTAKDLLAIVREISPCTFEAFVRTIVGQQVSTAAANTIWLRVEALADPFTPENVLKLSDAVLRSAGLSGQKVKYIRGLSQAIVDGTFDPKKLAKMSDERVIEAITALNGFGRWSAEMVLIFSLARPDIFSGGDLGLRVGIQRVLKMKERPTEKESIKLAERWAGHRTAASLLLWHTYHKEGPPKKLPRPLKPLKAKRKKRDS